MGWGCEKDKTKAFEFLRKKDITPAAGGNGATLFELGNSFRHGYETAARVGDADAMMEVAQCYLKEIRIKKDKKMAARYYRMVHRQGLSEVAIPGRIKTIKKSIVQSTV